MEKVLTEFLSVQTIIFVLIVYLAVTVFRKLVEASAPKIAHVFPDKWEPWWVEFWREWVLLSLPVIFGGAIAFFVSNYPYPEMFTESKAGRIFFGMVAGLCANNTFKFFNYYIKKLVPKRVEEEKAKISTEIPDEKAGEKEVSNESDY